ncbi:MAG: acyl-CoA dehydrogenase family protein [Myxococcota bacterium]
MDHSSPEGYAFDDYLETLGGCWLDGDPILARWLARSQLDPATLDWLRHFGSTAAGDYRALSERVERRQNLPFVAARGPYNRDEVEVVLPPETRRMLGEIHGSGLWRPGLDERARYAAVYLINQNGEAGVTCSTACTDGLARALRALGNDPRSRQVLEQLETQTPDRWIHGAQFVTEIQGGSDAATNALQARPSSDGLWSLRGQKWFCSNCTADYWLVTARVEGGPPGHRGIGLFCVPRQLEGAPNGYRILRLKDKLGTRALPTAELELCGAQGWPLGALDAGLKNTVAIVLTLSRIHNVLAAAALCRRASREAHAYADFRRAFGRKLNEHTLVAASLRRISRTADRTEAGAFATVDAWLRAAEAPADHDRTLWARVLVSIAKAVATRRTPGLVYEAMMVFGGNGIEERFCALPRLWRDAAILETWEGPYTLLLMQALGDLVKFGVKGREHSFLGFGLGDHGTDDDARELAELLAAPDDEENVLRWGALAPRLYERFEDSALEALSTDRPLT